MAIGCHPQTTAAVRGSVRATGFFSMVYSSVLVENSNQGDVMKIDLYTKAVLTVIAACLFLLVIQKSPLISEARAQGQGQTHVWIDGSNSYALQFAGPIATKQQQ
jgi:hypothetical protein